MPNLYTNHLIPSLKNIRDFMGDVKRQLLVSPNLINKPLNYDLYWDDRGVDSLTKLNAYQRARLDWIIQRVTLSDRLLDLGCGGGTFLSALTQKVGCKATGVDSSKRALKHLEQLGIDALFCDLHNMDSLNSLPMADHILLLEVLEHLVNPEEVLQAALGKATKSVIFSIPNTGYLPFRLRFLCLGKFPVQWRTHPSEHIRFWTYKDLKWWLTELDLFNRSEIHAYKGLPMLSKIWPNMFAAALICQISSNE